MNEKQLRLAYNYYKANYSDWQDKAPTFDIFKGKRAHPFVKQLYEEATQNVTEQEPPQSFIEEAAKAMKSNVDTALVGVEKEQAMGTNPFNFPTQKPLEVVGGSEGGLIDNSRKPINEWYNQDIFNSETFTPPTEGQNEVFKPTLRDKEVSKVHKEAFTNTFRERGLIGAEEGIEDYITPEGKKYGFDAKGVYERPIETKEDYLQTMTGDNRNFDYRFTREGRYIPDLSKNNVNRKRAEGWEDMIEFAQKNKYPNKDFTQVRDMLLGDKELFNQTVAEYQGQTGGDAFAQAAQNKIVNQYNQNRLKKGSNLTEQENQAFEGNANALLSSPEEVKAFTDPFMGYEQPKRKDTNELLAKIEKQETPGVIGKVWNIGNAINSVLPVPTLETPKERINKLQNIAESPSTIYNGTNSYLLNKALGKAKKEGRELTELQYKALETLANGAGEGRDNGDFNDRQRVIDELIASLSTGEESEDFSALIAAKSPEYKVSKYDNEDKSWATERGFDAQDNGERQLAWQVRNSKSTMHQLLTQPSKEFTSKLNEVFKKAEEQGADLNKVAEQQAPKLAEFTTPQEKLNAYYNILLTRLEKIGGELGIDKNLDPTNSGGKLDFKTAISALSFGENVAFNNKEIEYLSILNELKNLAPFMAKGLRPDEVDGGNAFTEFGNTFDEGLKGLLVPAAMQGSSSSGANKTLLKSLSDSGVLQSVAEQTVKGIEKRASDEMGLTTDYRSFEIPFIDITENGINPRLMGRTAGVLGGVGLTIAEQTLISRGLGIEGAIARTGGAFATLGTKLVSNEQKLAKALPYLKYADNLIKTGVEYEVMGRVGDKSAEYRDEMNFGTGVAGAAFSNIFKGAMRKWIGTKVVGVNAAGDPLYKGIMKNGAGRYATNKIGGAIAENLEEIPQEIWQTYSKSGGDMQKTYKELFGDSGVFGSWNNALGFVFSIGMFGHLDGFNKEDVKGLMQLAADRAKKESPKEGETITPALIDEMAEGIMQSAPAVTDIQRTEDGGVEFSSGQEVYHTSAEGVTTPVTDNGTVDMEKAEDVGKQLIQSVNDEGEREKTIESLSEKVDLNSPTQLNENLQSLRSKVDVNDLGVHDAIGTWVSYNAVGSNNIILVNVKNRIIKFKDAEGVNIESPLTEGEAAELMNMSSMLVSMRSKYLEKHGLSDEEEDEIDYYIHEKVAIKKATRKNQEQAENKQQIVSPINEQANETTSENGQTEQPEPTGVVTLTGEVDTAKSTDKKPVDDSNNGGANKQPIKTPKTVAHAGKDITEGEHIDSPRRIIISSLLKGLRLNTDDFRKALEGNKKVSNIGQFLFKFGSPNSKLSTGKDKENTAVSLPKQLWDNLTDQEREKYDEADFTEAWDRVLDEFNGEPQEVINSWKAELEEGRKTSERMKDNEGNATGEEESTNERRKQFSNKRKSKGVVVKPKEEDAEIPQLLEQEKWREQMEKEVADEYEREQLAQIDNETQEVSEVDEILLQLEKGDKETLSELERIIDSNTNEKGEVDYEGVQRGLFGEGVSEEFKQRANKIIEKHERAITERIKQKQSGKPNENEKETDSKGDSTDVDKSGEREGGGATERKPTPTKEDVAFREYEKSQGGYYNLEHRFFPKIKLWLKKIGSKINNFNDGYAKFIKENINILDDGVVTPREWETKDKVVYVDRKYMKYMPNIYMIYYNGHLVFQTTEYYTALIYTLDYLVGNEIPTAPNPNGLFFGEIKSGEREGGGATERKPTPTKEEKEQEEKENKSAEKEESKQLGLFNEQANPNAPKAQSEQRPSSPQIALAQRIMDFFIKKFGIDVFAPMSEFYTKLEELGYSTLNQAAADGQEVVKSPKGKIYGFTYGGKIYLNPEFVTGETVFHELTHIQQEVIKQAAKKGDVKAKNILAKFNHLLDTYLKQIEKGAKVVKIGGKEINLSSSIYRKQQDETAADYRDRMADELWAYLQAPENLAKFDKGIVRQFIDAVADFFRKVLGIEKKVKDIQSMNLRELIGLTSDMLAKGEYLKAVKESNANSFMAEGEEEAPTKSEEKMALELAKELLTTRFEELAAELGFPPKWEVMTDEERVELRDAISNNLQVYFPTHDWGRYDEETAMRIFDEVYSETGSESKAEAAAMDYLESFKLEGGISEMAAQRIAEETIDNFDKENAELIKNRRKEVNEVSGSKNKDTHRFYENVLKRVANLPEFAAAFVEKNKDIFQYVTANVEDIKRAAISLLMDYSVEAAVEIQRELGVSTEEGFNSMLDRDRMLGYKIEVRALQKIANKANKIANNELAVTLQEVILQTTATIIGLRRLMELEHELKGIAGNTNDGRQAQAQTLLKELSADETIPLYGQVMHDLAKIGWHQGVSIRMFALWSAVSKDALDRMLDAVEVEEMKKMKGKQKEAAKVIRDLRKQVADIQKDIAENMTVEEVDKALFDAENKELMDKLTQLFDKAAANMRENDNNKSSTKSRTSTNTNQHAGKETAEQKSSRVKRAATRGANILKNLFSSGQWQLGDTDTTTDIGKVQEAIAALQKAFPRVRIIFDQNVWDSEVGNANARGFIKRKEGRTYVYLNPSKVNLNTPYHELAHVVLDVFERENVALFNEAMRMIKGTKYYTDAVELYGEGITARREAFVEMVADKGVELAEKNKKLFNRIWAEIKDLFNKFLGGGVDLFKSKPMDRVTLNDIVKAAARKLQTGVEGDYMGAEAFSADVERQKAINSFIPLLDTIVGDNVVEAMDLDVLAEDLIYAINNLTNIGLSINDTKAIAFAKDVIAEYQKRTSIEIRLREEALEQYGKAQEIGGSSKGKTKNPDILARRLLLKSLADIAKERLKDDIAKDIEQAEEAAKAGQPYTSRYSQDAHKLYALVATGDFTQVEIKALEKALGLYEKDPNAWDRAFSLVDEMADKYANENGFTPEQREALATSIEELLYKEGLRRANITTGEIDEAKERLLTPIAIAKLRERIQGLSRKGKTEGDELAAQAKVIARREIAESIRDLMGKTPEQVQKFKDTFKESLLDAGLSPKLAEEIASVASKLIDDNIKRSRGKELRTLLKNAPEETEKRTKAERGRKDIKLWNRVMSGANEATMYENISFMSDSWTEEQIDKFAAAYGIPNFSSPIIRQRIKELAIAMDRTPMGWARIRASHDLMKYIGAKLYPIGGLGHITKRYWHFYYAGMLQNLPTHLVNFLMSLYRVLEDITSRLLRIGYNKLAKNERGEEAAKIGLQAYKNDLFTAVSVALSVFRGFEQMNEQKIENLDKGEQISSRYSLERESDYSSEGYDTGEKYLGVNVETGKWGIFEEILEGIKQFTSTKGEGAKGVIFSWVKLPFRALFAMDTFFRVLYTNSYALEASYNVERNNGNVEAYDTVLNKLYGESINEYENLAAQVALNAVKEGNANPQQEEIARLYNDILSQLSRGSVNIKDILNLERKQGYFLDKRGEASLSNERAREYEMRKSNLNKEYATAFFADQFASKMLLSETPTGIARFVYNIMNVATKIPLIGRMLFLFTKVPLNLANLWIDYSPFGIIRDLRDIFGLEGVSLLSYMSEATGVETDPTSAIARAAANLQRFQDEKERLEDKRDLLLEQVQKQSGVQQRITENAIKNIEKDIVEAQRRILAAQANYQMATERVYRKLLGFAVSSLFLPLAYIFGGYEDDEEKRKAKRKRFLIELQGAFPNGDVKRQKERRTAWAKNAMRIWLGGKHIDIPMQFSPSNLNYVFLANYLEERHRRNKEGKKSTPFESAKHALYQSLTELSNASGFLSGNKLLASYLSGETSAWGGFIEELSLMGANTVGVPIKGALGIPEEVAGLIQAAFITDANKVIVGQYSNFFNKNIAYKKNYDAPIGARLAGYLMKAVGFNDVVNPSRTVLVSTVTGQKVKMTKGEDRLGITDLTGMLVETSRDELANDEVMMYLIGSGLIDNIPSKVDLKDLKGKDLPPNVQVAYIEDYGQKAYKRLQAFFQNKGGFEAGYLSGKYDKEGKPMKKRIKGKIALTEYKAKEWEDFAQNNLAETYELYKEGKIDKGQMQYLSYAKIISSIYMQERKAAKEELEEKLKLGTLNDPTIIEEEN